MHDIVKGEPWQERLRSLIESADAMVFLISPDSVASTVCEWEVNEAELHEKRLFPVVARATPTAAIPQRLQRLNFTFLDRDAEWDKEGPSLLAALHEDVDWVREHTRLGELALRWERADHPSRQLLRGADLAAAERWRDSRPPTAPSLSHRHTRFLQSSRNGAQRRLRRWLTAAAVLCVSAIGLSSFALWQRELALSNEAIAERRAATLATDVALSRAGEGAADAALLMLLDASTRYAADQVPEKLLLGLHDVTHKAKAQRAFWFTSGSRAFHLSDGIAVFDPAAGNAHLIDPVSGERRVLGRYSGEVIDAGRSSAGLAFIGDQQTLYLFDHATGAPRPARQLAALLAPDKEKPIASIPPTLNVGADGELWGRLVVTQAATDKLVSYLWRYRIAADASAGTLQRVAIPDGLGEPVRLSGSTAFFWDARAQRMHRLDLDKGEQAVLDPAQAAALGLAPCAQVRGEPPKAYIETLFRTLRPGLEQVACAGVFGKLALMSQTRALARSLMDEYYLFPNGATATSARTDYWLGKVVERLGSAGDRNPFGWFTGSPEAGLVAVSHADRILLLALGDGRYLSSALYPDADKVAREIATPDRTDGGRFYAGTHLSFSGPDEERYRVTVIRVREGTQDTAGIVDHDPERAYWGNCGVQKPALGDTRGVKERAFSVEREHEGLWNIKLGGREVRVESRDLRCASASQRSETLAVVDESGVLLFRIDEASLASGKPQPAIARIGDRSVRAVSFLGAGHEALLTTHDYKVSVWRRGDGAYLPETVYRSKDSLMFAEASPVGQRMLVWESLGQADAVVRVVGIAADGNDWLYDGPHMLVGQPDLFFGPAGGVYRVSDGVRARLMPAVSLSQLATEATEALSPDCRPRTPGDYRSSPCWPSTL